MNSGPGSIQEQRYGNAGVTAKATVFHAANTIQPGHNFENKVAKVEEDASLFAKI